MTDQSPPTADLPAAQGAPGERYEATIHPADPTRADADALTGVSALDLDRVPDPAGGVRVLVDPNDISRLVAQGFEVRLHRAVPVQPLDPALVSADEDVLNWLTARITAGES